VGRRVREQAIVDASSGGGRKLKVGGHTDVQMYNLLNCSLLSFKFITISLYSNYIQIFNERCLLGK